MVKIKTNVLSLDGESKREIDLPKVFDLEIRPSIIRKAVHSSQSSRIQPKGPNPRAGMETTAETPPKGSGSTRVKRVKGRGYHAAGRGAWAPFTPGGRQAHPLKSEEIVSEDMNKKEKNMAVLSAISATKNKKAVSSRGHEVDNIENLPIVVDDEFEKIKKTREAKEVLEKIGVWADVDRVKNGKKIRSGRGKTRGRKYKKKTGPLIVVGEDQGIFRGARNLPGVDIVSVDNLNAEVLAPGGVFGRLTIWTESAIDKINKRFSS